jgi:CHAD domain-containing protein
LGKDIEELHDMRVATRRMRTAFDLFGQAFDPKVMKHYLKGLRSVGRVLGDVRDLDVILEHARDYQSRMEPEEQPGLGPLMLSWQQVISKKHSKLTRHLQSDGYQAFKLEFNAFLHSSGQTHNGVGESVMNAHLRDLVPVLIYGQYAAVKAYEAVLPIATIAQLHALRIEFKKFRYALEYFREILGEQAGKAIGEIKLYQDHLGMLHDADVACQLVDAFLGSWDKEQLAQAIQVRQNPEPIVSYLAFLYAERYRLMNSFPDLWRNFSRPEFRLLIAQAISQL